MTEQIGKLEERIGVLKTRLREFMDCKSIKIIEQNSWRKSINVKCCFETLDRNFVEKAVLLYEMYFLLHWLDESERKRTEKDKECTYSIIERNDETTSFVMYFPQKDKFFSDGHTTPLYHVDLIDFKEARESVKANLETYKEAVKFWENENEEQV